MAVKTDDKTNAMKKYEAGSLLIGQSMVVKQF
jgi:hypothetical protein